MNSNSDRTFSANTLRQINLHIAIFVLTLLENTFRLSLGTFDLSTAADVVLNAAFKTWKSVYRDPLLIVKEFHYHNILGYYL